MSFEIPITQHLESFYEHLQSNDRTIFSAKFGDGKSYFLKEFKEKYKDDYYFITLYPVNYSVAENADIFEYIKRDIIIRLAEDDILCNIDFEALADSIFNMENLMEVVSFLVSFLPHSAFIQKIIDKTKGIFDNYQKKKETYKSFLATFTHQKGGLYECDTYTKMIEQALQYINRSQKKKTLLIIEDLDRIDPAHLFRILNVLGAHLDFCNQRDIKPNKFGFDNIVTVFDYEITSHLFHHFYGKEANYNGYINKFITHYPFYYSINQIAIEYLYTYIDKECNIPAKRLKKLRLSCYDIETIGNKIDKLSVRDVKHILDDIEKQIICKTINANLLMKFYTLNSTTKFFAILKRMDINLFNIIQSLTSEFTTISERLNLTNSFTLCSKHIQNTDSIAINGSNHCFSIEKITDDKLIITELKFYESLSGSKIEMKVIDNIITKGLNMATQYIKP